jgi:hypothetical protein
MEFTLLGPTKKELTRLKGMEPHGSRRTRTRREAPRGAQKRIEDFSNGVLTTSPYDLRDWNGIPT